MLSITEMQKSFIVGIDEVGRGPVAGPVSVGIVVWCGGDMPDWGQRDSKVLTEKARERVYAQVSEARASGLNGLQFGVYSVSAGEIDANGISAAIALAIRTGLADLSVDSASSHIYLDGSLKAPPDYSQETIIRGDALIPIISLASIVAKVERDRYMTEVAHTEFPLYNFAKHKGYGTAAHLAAIRAHGITHLHRKTFLTGVLG